MRSKNHEGKVSISEVHGKYPYKLYLEIRGNSNIGRYIVVVSNSQLNKKEAVDEIKIKINNGSVQKKKKQQIVKPNMMGDGFYTQYKVREVSVLDIGNVPILVYTPIKERK